MSFVVHQFSKVDKHKTRHEAMASVVATQVIRQIEFFAKTKLDVVQSEHDFELQFDFIPYPKKPKTRSSVSRAIFSDT